MISKIFRNIFLKGNLWSISSSLHIKVLKHSLEHASSDSMRNTQASVFLLLLVDSYVKV